MVGISHSVGSVTMEGTSVGFKYVILFNHTGTKAIKNMSWYVMECLGFTLKILIIESKNFLNLTLNFSDSGQRVWKVRKELDFSPNYNLISA